MPPPPRFPGGIRNGFVGGGEIKLSFISYKEGLVCRRDTAVLEGAGKYWMMDLLTNDYRPCQRWSLLIRCVQIQYVDIDVGTEGNVEIFAS